MDINDICKKLEQGYNCSAVNFYKYNTSFVVKALDRAKDYASFRFFIAKDNEINELKDKVIIDYFSKGENEPSDIIYDR